MTDALRAQIERARAAGWLVDWKQADDASLAAMLARHIHDRAIERIAGVPTALDHRQREQVRVANRALEALAEYAVGDSSQVLIDPDALVLMQVDQPGSLDREHRRRPGIPLTTVRSSSTDTATSRSERRSRWRS